VWKNQSKWGRPFCKDQRFQRGLGRCLPFQNLLVKEIPSLITLLANKAKPVKPQDVICLKRIHNQEFRGLQFTPYFFHILYFQSWAKKR